MNVRLLVLLLALAAGVSALSWTYDKENPDAFKDPDVTSTTTTRRHLPRKILPRKKPKNLPRWSPQKPKNPKSKCRSNHVQQSPVQQKGVSMTCSNITAYFDGIFHNNFFKNSDQKVQFQLRLYSNTTDENVYGKIDKWNEKLGSSKDFTWGYLYDKCKLDETCKVSFDNFFGVYLTGTGQSATRNFNIYHFLYFDYQAPAKFNLEETIGQCTRIQTKHDCDMETDKSKHSFCICCGNSYNPDPALGCPKNPWSDDNC